MLLALRQLIRGLLQPIPLLSWLLASIIAGTSGPFRSAEVMDQPKLLIFWAVLLAGSFALAMGFDMFVGKSPRIKNAGVRAFAGASGFGVANVVYVAFVTWVFLPADYTRAPPAWMSFLIAFAIFLMVTLTRHLLLGAATAPPPKSPFFQRLKPELGKDLSWVRGQDHYVVPC